MLLRKHVKCAFIGTFTFCKIAQSKINHYIIRQRMPGAG